MKSGLGVIWIVLTIVLASCSSKNNNNADTQSETSEELSPLASLCRSIDYSDTASLSDERIMTLFKGRFLF